MNSITVWVFMSFFIIIVSNTNKVKFYGLTDITDILPFLVKGELAISPSPNII